MYGNASAIQELGDIKIKLQRELQESPESEVTTRNLDRVNQLIYAAKHPVDTWNVTTQNEVYALNQFTNGKSAYTPHLLDVIVREVWEDLDVVGMVKGYIVFTIMTKLPGKRLRHAIWRCWPLEKRDKIRAPFKEAIL